MKFGFQVMLRGAASSGDGLSSIAKSGEDFGFDIIAPNDHLIVPGGIESTYPYTDDGIWPGASVVECHDQLTAMAFIAGHTDTIRLLTSVMVVPYRQPVLTAKTIATADVLSQGRVILGCGVGWMSEEMEAIGTEPFQERGKVTDEYIRVFKELWTSDEPSYSGEYVKFADVLFKPQPLQKPHPPIWIGGESKAALRRVARLGDGWFPAANNPKFTISNPKDFRNEIVNFVLRARANNNGKNPSWLSYEKLRVVIEKKMFSNTEDLLPVISFNAKASKEDQKKHNDFVVRMVERGYTEKQVRLLSEWYLRVRKSQ